MPPKQAEEHSAGQASLTLPGARLGLVLLVIAPFLLALDLTVAEWARQGLFPRWIVKAAQLSECFAHGYGVVACAVLVWLLDDLRSRAFYIAFTSLGAGLVADLVKLCIFRIRPRDFDFAGDVWSTFDSWFPIVSHPFSDLSSSMPSSHAATAAGLAFALITVYPRGKPLFFALLLFAGLQRIFSLAHFPSDVFVGAGLGWLCAWLASTYFLPQTWWRRAGQPQAVGESSGPVQNRSVNAQLP